MRSEIKLDPAFGDQLEALAKHFEHWSDEMQRELVKAHQQIGLRHKTEAMKRVPVEFGTLKQSIMTNTYSKPGEVVTETGTNLEYGVHTEFGTEFIAKGNVKRIGTKPIVTDAEAIKVWPAKNVDRINKAGEATPGAVVELEQRLAGTGVGEQMPWLRPAFHKIRPWALQRLFDATKPPPKK